MNHYNVVAAVVVNQGKVLCMQKGITKYQYTSLHWEFPGGKIEEGETEQEALHRELLEEMDYDVTVGDKLCTVEHTYPDFSITMHVYLCSASSRNFTRKEHAASLWLNPQDLKTLEWCEADKPIVEAINKR